MQTTVDERIKYFYSEYLKMRQVDFSKKLRITKSAISNLDNGENAPSYRILESIEIHYPMLNGHWLLTGNGNMFIEEEKKSNTKANEIIEAYEKLPEDKQKYYYFKIIADSLEPITKTEETRENTSVFTD